MSLACLYHGISLTIIMMVGSQESYFIMSNAMQKLIAMPFSAHTTHNFSGMWVLLVYGFMMHMGGAYGRYKCMLFYTENRCLLPTQLTSISKTILGYSTFVKYHCSIIIFCHLLLHDGINTIKLSWEAYTGT